MGKKMKSGRTSKILILTRSLFFISAAAWLILGTLTLMRALANTSDWRMILSGLMITNAAVMAWFGVKIVRAQNHIIFFAIIYMTLNVVLSVTDQFGWIDALILLLNLIVLGLLFVAKQRVKQSE